MRIKRNYCGPLMFGASSNRAISKRWIEEEEHLSIAQLWRRRRVEPAESIVSIAMIDPKGKVAEVPTSNS